MMTTQANVTDLGADSHGRVVVGSRAEVKKYVYAAGLMLGEPTYKVVDVVDRKAVHNGEVTGYQLVDVNGSGGGLIVFGPRGTWSAVVHLRYLAA
jgi:hypothetical protein